MSFVPNNLDVTHRIFGGKEARPNSWPSIAYVLAYLGNNQASSCGGTLISKNEILTAAQ
jgi:secreted trypsin-like serine protease